ncbi:MAG: hypothetical protein AABX47_09490 [Nanoarchaeota archaeon]
MVDFPQAVGMVAPYYNLAFTVVVVYLFIQLFRTYQEGRKVYFAPWGYIFAALMVFVLEEVITVLRVADLIQIPLQLNGFFELVIISLFIYALLLQREWVRKEFGSSPAPLPSASPDELGAPTGPPAVTKTRKKQAKNK